MPTPPLILALDQGTTSSRAILFRAPELVPLARAQRKLPQIFPQPGLVEHDPEVIWSDCLAVLRETLATNGTRAAAVAAIGITNQRETTLLWERASGKPIHNAIVWQDRRTAEICARFHAEEAEISARTGLVLDPYFSASKLAWLLENVAGARAAAEAGRLAFGTIDCFLLFRLTGGRVHATDATNASRTLLYNIHHGAWDEALLRRFRIPRAILPEIRDSAGRFGETAAGLFERAIPIEGVAGDQQAATIGQSCFDPGMAKATYGTGAFLLLNTGKTPIASKNRLLTTIAWQLDGVRTYALEGAIFNAGSVVQWLGDRLGLVTNAAEVNDLAARGAPGVTFVPAFTGLGAPWWDSAARGALLGLTRGAGPAEIARAALESIGFQTRDLMAAMQADLGATPETVLRVDGGMAASDWTMQFIADVLGVAVDRPTVTETTARGAAYLAGLAAGVCPEPARFAELWRRDKRFVPGMSAAERERRYALWRDAVLRILTPRRTQAGSRSG